MRVKSHLEHCEEFYKNQTKFFHGTTACPAIWDTLLCWPPTAAGETAKLPCPPLKGIDVTKFAIRVCSLDGRWQGLADTVANSSSQESNPQLQESHGWTNYSECFLPEIRDLLKKLESGTEYDAQVKLTIAYSTKILEMIGLSISLLSLIISLVIFSYFRSLENHRTRIHKNLFAAMAIQMMIRLCLYSDQETGPQQSTDLSVPINNASSTWTATGIHHIPIVCESFYAVLEYARTTMFMWMFIEGLYLHNLITVMTFRPDAFHKFYLVIGWGLPFVLTAAWAAYLATFQKTSTCWWGYSLTPSYWIVEGPRLGIILVNLFYLLNIIRVLVTKLRNSRCTEVQQARKAAKATGVLLPLLGITNALVMVNPPIARSAWEFALWAYLSHFLTSFQGFFVSLIYCFLNGEVRSVIVKRIEVYVIDNRFGSSFVGSHFLHGFSSNADLEPTAGHFSRSKRDQQSSTCPTVTTHL